MLFRSDKNVVIGDNNKIMPNANILYGSRIGNGNTIFPGAVIGGIPQDLKYKGEETTAEIGDNNVIRENVTVNRGTAAKGKTVVGNNNLLMEGVHVAHDAIIGNGCIIGNSTKMAGEIIIGITPHMFSKKFSNILTEFMNGWHYDMRSTLIA